MNSHRKVFYIFTLHYNRFSYTSLSWEERYRVYPIDFCLQEQLGISSTLFKTIAGSYNRERKWRDFLLRSEILQLVIDFTVISTRFLPREGCFVVETGKFPKNVLSLGPRLQSMALFAKILGAL